MGLFDKIKSGIRTAVGSSVERGVSDAVEKTLAPKVSQAAETVAAEAKTEAAAQSGIFSQIAGAAQGFVNDAAKNMKICPSCGEGAPADNKFCPSCGCALPEKTIADGAVCSSCGRANDIGQRFCADCGEKLPAAIEEEDAAKARDEAVLDSWEEFLPQYPRWASGGFDLVIDKGGDDEYGKPYYFFSVRGTDYDALNAYRELLKQNGFRPAGENPSEDVLYKKIGGQCYYFESCEPFCSDPGLLGVSFGAREPKGGFDYVKPEKKEKGFFGLFKK